MHPCLTLAEKAEVAATLNGLPHARITDHDGAAHVFTASLTELEQWARWLKPLGACITRQDAGPGVALWTVTATLGDIRPLPVRVHALALDTDLIDADLTPAVA